MDFLLEGFKSLTLQQPIMWLIGGLLIFLAIKKDMEPALLLPMGFGAILVNLPLSPVIGSGVEKMGIKEDPSNHLLMHAVGSNVSGQIASAIVGGLIIGLLGPFCGL